MTNRLIMFISVNLVFFPLMTMFLSKLVRTRMVLKIYRKMYRSKLAPRLRGIISRTLKIKPYAVLDDLGIPIMLYEGLEPQRNPVTVCIVALRYYKEGRKSFFLNCANWLVDNLSHKGAFSVWEHKFPWKIYNLKAPWVSGLAQGLGIKVLVLAHKQTLNEKFINAALKALQAFITPIDRGGVLYIDKSDGGWWYEEYASPNSIRSYVLNGHVCALEGVHELYLHTKSSTALKIFNRGLDELKRHLNKYDTGSWTYYDRLGLIASRSYHKFHVKQMHSLWEMTGDKFFLKYYRKWKEYIEKSS